MIVRWGLESFPSCSRSSESSAAPDHDPAVGHVELPAAARFSGVRRHAPLETVEEAVAAAAGADGLVALGGGSAIDTAKAVSAATGLPVVSIPTTYSGAEWTPDSASATRSVG